MNEVDRTITKELEIKGRQSRWQECLGISKRGGYKRCLLDKTMERVGESANLVWR